MQVLAIWGFFAGLVVGTLMVGMLRHMDKPQPLSLRAAAAWTGTWIGLAALFGVAVFAFHGMDKGTEFVTGYITEWCISVGILFMFLMIFRYFRVPELHRQRVLFWGIVGAIVLRGVFLYGAAGTQSYFAWLVYAFGASLVYAGIRLMHQGEVHGEPQDFLVRRDGKSAATVLVPAMIAVAMTDVIFAVYSVPAILVITQDPFIVYAANLYAVLGLRALFYLLAAIMGTLRFLQAGLCTGLMIAGAGMIISRYVPIPAAISLGVMATVLAGSVVASLLFPAVKVGVPETGKESLAESSGSAGKDTGEDKEEHRRAA